MVEAADQEWTSNRSSRIGYSLTGTQLLDVRVDAQTGTAELTWTAYTGPDFEAYEVVRLQAGEVEVSQMITEVADTTFTDTDLRPDTEYTYQVRLHAAGATLESNQLARNRFALESVDLLSGEVAPTEGTVRLTWSGFTGPDFQAYRVLRRIVGTDAEEELHQTTSPGDTTFTDQTARAAVDYLYTVLVEAAGQELVSNALERRLTLPPVQIQRLDLDANTASATIEWTPYEGPHFRAYRLLRRTEELAAQPVAEDIEDITSTTFIDRGLAGNTEYFYQVVVLTDRDERAESVEQSGVFHPLLETCDHRDWV